MISRIIIFKFLICFSSHIYAQSKDVEIRKGFVSYSILHQGKTINHKEFVTLYESYPSNLTFAKQSKSAKTWSNVATFTGGILLGWYTGELISEDTQNHEIGIAGLSLVALSIPLNIRSFKKASNAIRQEIGSK